ncbi:hypothetical protein MKY91_03675 [Alkalicoccobacillus gibsonii]|uniref:Uncharacterized protein n=1 Tax=Alkalicoccobacillus gibsonii TaxID=79881 RepID=A0ABU9VEC6_9BACI
MVIFNNKDERIANKMVTALYVEKDNHTIIIGDEESTILADKLDYIDLKSIERSYNKAKLMCVNVNFEFPDDVTLHTVLINNFEYKTF